PMLRARERGGPGHQGVGVVHPMEDRTLPARAAQRSAQNKKTKKDQAQNRNGATLQTETARVDTARWNPTAESILAVLAIQVRAGPFAISAARALNRCGKSRRRRERLTFLLQTNQIP